ncbi:hypothetical protein G4G30_16825 [Stenotrophomonas maltophilia]|nr:hypothetical protein G4G30_16825 [Stenotrophomonas maltophilia]
MNLERTIFVQIPSYRDPQLLPTLKDMIENAKSPFLLRVVICWQHGSEQDIQSFEANGFELTHTATEEGTTVHFLRIHGANIELIDIDYVHSKGCGWARNLAQRRYRGEHYNLQIDSHHRFSGEWDLKMKSLLERPRVHSPRPVLTGCPPASILGSEMEGFGIFGLGSQRTLRQYERHTGINFRLRAVHKQSLTVQEPVRLSETIEENEWKRSLVYFRSMRVHISCATRCPSFPASVLVSSYSSDGVRQSTRELSKSELKSLSREGQVQYIDTLRAPLHQLPVRYSVHVRSDDALTDHQLSIFVEEVLL